MAVQLCVMFTALRRVAIAPWSQQAGSLYISHSRTSPATIVESMAGRTSPATIVESAMLLRLARVGVALIICGPGTMYHLAPVSHKFKSNQQVPASHPDTFQGFEKFSR